MKLIFYRFLAILLLLLPGLLATYGFLQAKNAIFDYIASIGTEAGGAFAWLNFLWGVLCFAAGVAFIGGWIFYRDRKHNYLAPRFKQKK